MMAAIAYHAQTAAGGKAMCRRPQAARYAVVDSLKYAMDAVAIVTMGRANRCSASPAAGVGAWSSRAATAKAPLPPQLEMLTELELPLASLQH